MILGRVFDFTTDLDDPVLQNNAKLDVKDSLRKLCSQKHWVQPRPDIFALPTKRVLIHPPSSSSASPRPSLAIYDAHELRSMISGDRDRNTALAPAQRRIARTRTDSEGKPFVFIRLYE